MLNDINLSTVPAVNDKSTLNDKNWIINRNAK